MPIKRKDFASRVKLIPENDNVRSLFKYKLPKDEEEYVIIVNSIYKKRMGKTKIVCGKMQKESMENVLPVYYKRNNNSTK